MTANVDNVPLPESVFRSVQIVLPTIEYKSVEQIGFGMNRRVYRVSDGQTYWAISIAKSCVYSEINSFRQEVKLLNYLQDIIVSGITPQDAQLVESQDGHFAMIYRFIEGRNLSSVTIPESKLNILAIQIANFFYQLHTISLDSLDSIDIQTINLLDDHLVDILLDSAASGWNTVEREGISIRHPARFVLVGSGNPEEGELRPQLLDRFGMHAEIRTVREPVLRVQIVEERTSFDRDPQEWIDTYKDQQNELRESLIAAKNILPDVKMDYENRVRISQVCSELKVDGLRGDIVVNRAAKAYTAFNGRTDVTVDDISKIITLCLRHRLRKDPLESIDSGDKVKKVFNEIFEFTDEV